MVFLLMLHLAAGRVTTYGPGDAFGELALMYTAPRAATCIAREDTSLWCVDRVTFRSMVMGMAVQKRTVLGCQRSCFVLLLCASENKSLGLERLAESVDFFSPQRRDGTRTEEK